MTSPLSIMLALEASTDVCSVGLCIDGEMTVISIDEPRAHAKRIMGLIDELLLAAGIDLDALTGIVYGQGPGSFTGVRIAVAVAQGLAKGLHVPVLGLSSLSAIAANTSASFQAGDILVAQDARLGEVYLGRYARDQAGIIRPVQDDMLLSPDAVSVDGVGLLVGNAWSVFPDLSAKAESAAIPIDSAVRPDAIALLRIGLTRPLEDWHDADNASAAYLRNDVAKKSAPR